MGRGITDETREICDRIIEHAIAAGCQHTEWKYYKFYLIRQALERRNAAKRSMDENHPDMGLHWPDLIFGGDVGYNNRMRSRVNNATCNTYMKESFHRKIKKWNDDSGNKTYNQSTAPPPTTSPVNLTPLGIVCHVLYSDHSLSGI